MVFSSALFIYVFLPVFFSLYFLAPARSRNALILIASLVFYTAGAGLVVLSLLVSIAGNQFVAQRLADPAGVSARGKSLPTFPTKVGAEFWCGNHRRERR